VFHSHHNFRYATNILRRSPGFASVAILIFALGIGANTAIFTLVDTVLLRPLPYQDPSSLVMLFQSLPAQRLAQVPVSQADFTDFQKQSRSFESMAALYIDKEEFGLTGSGDPSKCAECPSPPIFFPSSACSRSSDATSFPAKTMPVMTTG
jgi:hypothetical protein